MRNGTPLSGLALPPFPEDLDMLGVGSALWADVRQPAGNQGVGRRGSQWPSQREGWSHGGEGWPSP